MEFRQFIAILPAFAELPPSDFEALLQVLHYEPHAEAYAFFTQGTEHPAMYLLLEGGVRVTHHDDAGAEVDAQELRGGEIFGLLGLVENLPATSTAVATSPVGVVSMSREAYHWLFAAAPTLAHRLQYMIAVQLARELQYRNRLLRARIRQGTIAAHGV